MKSPVTSPRKAAANRRNARQSTGPRTAAGKTAASLNALKHGLNTPVPVYMVRACEGQYGDLLNHVRATSATIDGSDLVYAVATRARLRGHRAELMQTIVEAGLSDDMVDFDALRLALTQLGRLETYERKSLSRLGRLLEDRPGLPGETKPRVREGRVPSMA
jgi:hypothetical protein